MASQDTSDQKPHAVCIPCPLQGHINPMTKLARLFHHRGFHITFVHTEYNYGRLLRSRRLASLLSLPSFQFETIPDGLAPTHADATQDIAALFASVEKNCALPFKQLLEKLAKEKVAPPVTFIISDVHIPFTLDVAEEMGIPNLQLWTSSASAFFGCTLYKTLIEKGIVPLKDADCLTNGYLVDKVIEWVGEPLTGIRLRDLPSFIRTTDPNDFNLNYVLSYMEKLHRSTAIILNTFDALEGKFLSVLAPSFPPFYTVGPLSLLLDQIKDHDETIPIIGSNLWQEDDKCIDWLDAKGPKSVVYVNFGSIIIMTSQQMAEFAWGLANSGKNFQWIVRPDLISGESAMLPPEFVIETKDRALMADWCDQERILKHSAIVGFFTHNGWNSTIESIFNGLPMISWPFFADQQTNCWYCRELGITIEIDNNIKREEVTKKVIELMDGEKGRDMKRKVNEWKRLSHEAVYINKESVGNSWLNFDKIINEVILSPPPI